MSLVYESASTNLAVERMTKTFDIFNETAPMKKKYSVSFPLGLYWKFLQNKDKTFLSLRSVTKQLNSESYKCVHDTEINVSKDPKKLWQFIHSID